MTAQGASQKIATRLYLAERLFAEATIGLDHGRSHFLRSVLRLSRGAPLSVFNEQDGEWLARIDGLGKGWCSLIVESQRRPPAPESDLWLVFAPIKRARLDFLIEKATELGCSRLQPVFTRHTDVSRINLERLRANAREAAEQCERLTLPEVCESVSFDAFLADWPRERRLLICAESGPATAIAEVVAGDDDLSCGWAVMCGPEGGYAESELDALRQLPFARMVSLGPRILRADTAALMALGCWQAWRGERQGRPFGRTGNSGSGA
ncbi:MAG: 16S rRNA (uracil(1498)-N(3))-methyltransferase [Pseudomonadota bacterium]